MKKLLTFVRHYKGFFVAACLGIAINFWAFGCESEVKSLRNNTKVTRAELQIEIDSFTKEVELRIVSLDKQDAMKAEIFRLGLIVAEGGISAVNPIGAVLNIAGLLGIGLAFDNRKKDAIIKGMKRVTTTTN